MEHTIRTFIALVLPDDCKKALAQVQEPLRSLPCDVRWEDPEKFHITLKFLGDTSAGKISFLSNALREHLREICAFDIHFTTLGAFPTIYSPRVLWVGLTNRAKTQELNILTETACQTIGFPAERKEFHPHVTLGRVKGQRNLSRLTDAIKTSTFDAIPCRCNEVALMKSELKPEGSRYTVIQTFPLQP